MRNLTTNAKTAFTEHLFAFGLRADARHREVVVTNDISRTIATYEESSRLAVEYSDNQKTSSEFRFTLEGDRQHSIDAYVRTLGALAVTANAFNDDAVLKSTEEMTDICREIYPDVTEGHAKYYAMCSELQAIREGAFYPKDLKDFPGGPNLLYPIYSKISHHTSTSKLNNDPIGRILNDWASPIEPPNCLANAVTMVSMMKSLGLRFYLASGLRLVSSDCRLLRMEALSRSLDTVADLPELSWVADSLREKISELFDHNTFDWMYHHFVVVQVDEANDEWAIFDPYMNESTFMPCSPKLTQLADALDARKNDLPGLAVPVDLTGSFSKKQMTRLKGRLTRVEKHMQNLVRVYTAKKPGSSKTVSLERISELFSDDALATDSLKWLTNKLNSSKYQDQEVLDALSVLEAVAILTSDTKRNLPKTLYSLESQLCIAQCVNGREGVPWLISRAINVGMISASLDGEGLIGAMGNPMFELYADHNYMLGLLLSSAVVASTGYRALSPELLRLTSSQLIWQEIAEKEYSYDSIPIRVARNTADSYIGKMPESWLHPLVLQRRELLELA